MDLDLVKNYWYFMLYKTQITAVIRVIQTLRWQEEVGVGTEFVLKSYLSGQWSFVRGVVRGSFVSVVWN